MHLVKNYSKHYPNLVFDNNFRVVLQLKISIDKCYEIYKDFYTLYSIPLKRTDDTE